MDDLKEKIEKLPKWAKDHIKRLEIQNDHYKEILESQQESDVWTGSELYKDKVFLPSDKITYKLNDDWKGEIQVRMDHRNGSDERFLHIIGDDRLIIMPEVSNVINIFLYNRD